MILFSPLIFDKEVTLQNRLNYKVVLFVATFEKVLLHDGELRFIYADKTRLSFSNCHLLSYLQVPIEEDFFSKGPADINATN